MEPFARRVETLFSAASRLDHWKDFKAYEFHNCPYDKVYSSISKKESILTRDLIRDLPADTSLIMVGDASMAPTELTARYGAIDYWHRNETPGVEWLKMLRSHFKRTVWLNESVRANMACMAVTLLVSKGTGLLKEAASLGGDVYHLVSPPVAEALRSKYGSGEPAR